MGRLEVGMQVARRFWRVLLGRATATATAMMGRPRRRKRLGRSIVVCWNDGGVLRSVCLMGVSR